MLVLPPNTQPPDSPTKRSHCPPSGPYTSYSKCLRWEFSFTCALCLLHERDFEPAGTQGFRSFWIEHREPQSSRLGQKRIDDYTNVVYACQACNFARGNRYPVIGPNGVRLL